MIRDFGEVEGKARQFGPKRVVVLFPHEGDVIHAVFEGMRRGYIVPLLVGDGKRVEAKAKEHGISLDGVQLIPERDPQKGADLCVEMVIEGKADFLIKGNVTTTYLYRSLLRANSRITPSLVPSTLCFHQIAPVDHLFVITDPGVNIAPDLDTKLKVIKNALEVLRSLGYRSPRVMILSGARAIDPDLPSLRDALAIREIAEEGELGECRFFDGHSFADLPQGEFPDLLIVPQIEAGNIIVKAIDHLGMGVRQCVTVGGGIVALTPSRSDGFEVRLLNIALGVLIAHSQGRR